MSKQARSNQPDDGFDVVDPIQQAINLSRQGKRTLQQWKDFNQGKNPFEVNTFNINSLRLDSQASPEDAMVILGNTKIISPKQHVEGWKQPKPELILPPRYTIERLENAAQDNEKTGDNRLVVSEFEY